MTEPKWTPGPWRVGENVGNGIPICAPFYPLAHVEGSVIHRYCTAAAEEEKANARLIAAAPELYEVLADFVKTYDEPGTINIVAFIPALRAALAKARGEP
jgi:hypothetical protein